MTRQLPAAALLAAALGAAGSLAQTDGTLDTAFDFDGSARVPFDLPDSSLKDLPVAVVVQPDGRVVVVGTVDDGTLHRDVAVARLTSAGALDPGFGTGGKYVAQYSYDEVASAVALLADGSILVAGSWGIVPPGSPTVFLRVLSAAGAEVTGAGIPVNGTLLEPRVGLAYDRTAGKIYVAFSRQVSTTPTIAILRLNEDLSTDFGYGASGLLEVEHFLGAPLYVRALALDGQGRLVVGATEGGSGGLDFCVMRATSGGALDATFGSGGHGYQTVPIELVAGGDDDLQALAVDASGRILLAGAAQNTLYSDRAAVLARLTASGASDPAFNGGAPLIVADTLGDDSLGGLAVQSDGRIVVAGKVFGPSSRFFAARYWPDGAADWSFGSFGQFSANFPNSPNDDYAVALALSGGRAVLVGPAEWSAPDYDFGVMRLASALIFADDLERGSTGAWSLAAP